MRRLSIKLRVTLWYTGLFGVLTALVLVFLITNSVRTTTASIQKSLVDAVMEATDEIEYDGEKLEVDDDVEDFDGVSILVYDRNEELVYGRRPSGFAAPIEPGQLQTASAEHHQWYVYDLSVEVDGYGTVMVRGIASSAAALTAGSAIRRLALTLFPVLLLVAGAGGYLITKLAFLPVRRIASTANSISNGGDLSRRIQLAGARDEIQALAITFNGMFERLEQSFLGEKRFTSDASHELRTPVAVIISQCEYALSTAATDSDRQAALGVILTTTREMAALIDQLLSLARMDADQQQTNLEEVDLGFLLESIAEEIQVEAARRQIVVHTEMLPGLVIHADQTLITRMLMNLLDNAVKYGKPCGDVWICACREADMVVCTIRDNGVGIAAEDLDRIWERFYRGNHSRGEKGGFGLGLPMVKWIVQAHGGAVGVQSAYGKGSTFTIRLPLS